MHEHSAQILVGNSSPDFAVHNACIRQLMVGRHMPGDALARGRSFSKLATPGVVRPACSPPGQRHDCSSRLATQQNPSDNSSVAHFKHGRSAALAALP